LAEKAQIPLDDAYNGGKGHSMVLEKKKEGGSARRNREYWQHELVSMSETMRDWKLKASESEEPSFTSERREAKQEEEFSPIWFHEKRRGRVKVGVYGEALDEEG